MGRKSTAREHLIDSAAALMHERGYTAVGVSEICADAGVQKGSFYHFFPSKVELALAVIERYSGAGAAAREELIHGEALPLERLAAHLDGLYRDQVELRRSCGKVLGCPIGNLGLEMSTQEPALRDRLRREFERTIDDFEAVLRQAVEAGELELADARQAARSLLALVEGAVMLSKMSDDPDVLRDLRRDAFALIGAEVPAAS